jgi:hypothetical protein
MTLEWQDTDPDETAGSEALAILASTSLPLVAASPTTVTLNGALPDGLRLPAPLRVVISHAEDSFAFQLTAVGELPSPEPGQSTLAVAPADRGVWTLAATDFTAGIEPTLGEIAAAAREFGGRAIVEARPGWRERMHARRPLLGLALLTGVFASIVSLELYDRFYRANANASFVSIDLVPVQSPGSGRIIFLADKVRLAAGEPVIGVTQRSGNDVNIESPCACDVFARLVSPGAVVRRGDRVLYLARPEARPFIVANVDRSLLFRFGQGAHVRIAYGDGVIIERDLAPVKLVDAPQTAEETAGAADRDKADTVLDTVNLWLDPGRDLDRRMIGAPVAVTFDLFRNSPIARLMSAAGVWHGIGSAHAS